MVWLGVTARYHGAGSGYRGDYRWTVRFNKADEEAARKVAKEERFRHDFGDGACVCFLLNLFEDRFSAEDHRHGSHGRIYVNIFENILREKLEAIRGK